MPVKRVKYGIVLVIIAASALALLAATQTWYTVQLTADANHSAGIDVPGSMAAPALTALSIAGLALALALAISGRLGRIVLTVLGLLVGGSVILSAVTAIANPPATVIATVTKATGIAGETSVTRLIGSVDASFWPVAALIGGILIVLAGLAVAITGHRWPSSSHRYDSVRFVATDAEADPDRDARSDAAGGAGSSGSTAHPERPPAANARDAAIDTWDDLSRGEDPTR
ncbi:Trp biosynthesis-associated membrane protein [Rathayibacter soli]|uniref:Trp biosynthesis-associated membrane protein n=1 Tax=Rathayibacter soli TaxID=3144168 RepID=UPI0027E4F459|nr:Trp biosynthesis-associated membrane protein [Glaciibacter superstes]